MFDARSILSLFGLFSTFIGLLFVYYVVANKRYNWHLISFTLGKFFQGVAVIGLTSSSWTSDYFALHISNAFLLLGYALEVYNVATFDNRPNKTLFWGISILTFLGIIFSLSFPRLPYHDVIEIHHLIVALCFGFGAFYLFTQAGRARFVVLVAVTYTLFSLAFLNSSITAIVQDEKLTVFDGSTIREAFLYFFAGLNLIVGSVGYLLILKDLDEQQITANNKKIESDNQKLAQLNAKKDRFFSIIAHDLKGPISGVMSLGEILQKKHDEMTEEKRNELFQLLVNSIKDTSNLLENLLLWSRSESKNIEVNPESLNIESLVDNSLNLLKQIIENKQISIEKNVDNDIHAWADENMISTVIRNILSNATKYVEETGEIYISCKKDESNNEVSLSIADNGIGMEKDVLDQLFDIDSNHSTRGTHNEPGTGLGLKICKEFIVMNGGTIEVQSKLNEGSTFTISLPMNGLHAHA